MHLRPATAEDSPSLVSALLEAMNWGETRFTRQQITTIPHLAHYVTGWPRPGDFGVVAFDVETSSSGATMDAIGASWCRQFLASDPGYGYIADDIPELTIGVAPAHRGQGVGRALLTALIEEAQARGLRAISLSVEDGNQGRALYDRAGFVVTGRNGNSDTMRLDIAR
jgi:ribosomal protein S18 acetylase RimI-like enzyme